MSIIAKVFGTYSEREVKKIKPILEKVLSYEDAYSKLSEAELRGKTFEFQSRLSNGESLDSLLPEAFATMREAAFRVLGMKPYPVQVLGGIILHQGRIAEMKTGEGKTLVATMPVYLNALTGKGVYVVTVNDYLAKRDSEWMGAVYKYLGLSVGVVLHDMLDFERKEAYKSDITYGTNNEIGFDYLRDNMVTRAFERVQRGFNYAIIDEVDSILIDEARTPLIISGQGDDVSDGYKKADIFVRKLKGIKIKEDEKASKLETIVTGADIEDKYADYDYIIDEKHKNVSLTEKGITKAEGYYNIENLGDIDNMELNHYITRALKAHSLFKKDVDYIVSEGEILIIDEHTGRLMAGRRYSEGVHQAIEEKEGVEVKRESKTLATITFQNLFRKFNKLSGMTGTALTEEEEFRNIYNLDVVEIPTNNPIQRIDKVDKVYPTKEGKLRAVVSIVKDCYEKGQPILVGTASVESSEELSTLLKSANINHSVLNAKYHEQEAQIVAKAGEYKSVTIATNMAGRGTDILLGGNPDFKALEEMRRLGYTEGQITAVVTHKQDVTDEELEAQEKYRELFTKYKKEMQPEVDLVRQLGGLYILGTERHESRRIDNQLRGRAGRQGDVGASEFIVSLEDDLMRLFGIDKLRGMFEALKISEDTPIDARILSNSLEKAQKKVESMHYGVRKTLLEYDMVMDLQRELVYKQRSELLEKESIKEDIQHMFETYLTKLVNANIMNPKKVSLEDQENIVFALSEIPGLKKLPNYTEDELYEIKAESIISELVEEVQGKYNDLEKTQPVDYVRDYEKRLLLFLLDTSWQEHIVIMDDLKQGIGLRAIGQQDPLMAYKNEGFDLFEAMTNYINHELLRIFMGIYADNVENKDETTENQGVKTA